MKGLYINEPPAGVINGRLIMINLQHILKFSRFTIGEMDYIYKKNINPIPYHGFK